MTDNAAITTRRLLDLSAKMDSALSEWCNAADAYRADRKIATADAVKDAEARYRVAAIELAKATQVVLRRFKLADLEQAPVKDKPVKPSRWVEAQIELIQRDYADMTANDLHAELDTEIDVLQELSAEDSGADFAEIDDQEHKVEALGRLVAALPDDDDDDDDYSG